eukprot:CAMPEP_0202399602 /NCGR_PEP_ID=MMETSP1128-20130828/2123_1 /ASSEMBLY_ACC=CAM_ASM_000463 /TAXON_ID=3047 /ORGANISM="Dunaliella tertiolecta, Strain CCMP1320" /LENGTH=234 /DNA_ID=CAMNT_0049002969 /DNA_START=32 /DNA_END=736 /DNA_ORIENTATION=-
MPMPAALSPSSRTVSPSCPQLTRQLPTAPRRQLKRSKVAATPSDEDRPSSEKQDDLVNAFQEELKRRGMEAQRAAEYLDAQQKKAQAPQNPFEASSSNGASRPRAPPPPMADMPGSSRRGAKDEPRAGGLSGQAGDAFNGPNGANEGLGGLVPRGLKLLQLGFSIFLGFLPFMAGFSALFTAIWLVFGDAFFHYGDVRVNPNGGIERYQPQRPKYLEPSALLSEDTVDPYVPLR